MDEMETEELTAEQVYRPQDIVWVKISGMWWVAEVQDQATLDPEVTEGLKKQPLVVVKFLNEDTYEHVRSWDNIFHYNNSKKKEEFLKLGFKKYYKLKNEKNVAKFPDDIQEAERRTGGNPEIINDPQYLPQEALESKLENSGRSSLPADFKGKKAKGLRRSAPAPSGSGDTTEYSEDDRSEDGRPPITKKGSSWVAYPEFITMVFPSRRPPPDDSSLDRLNQVEVKRCCFCLFETRDSGLFWEHHKYQQHNTTMTNPRLYRWRNKTELDKKKTGVKKTVVRRKKDTDAKSAEKKVAKKTKKSLPPVPAGDFTPPKKPKMSQPSTPSAHEVSQECAKIIEEWTDDDEEDKPVDGTVSEELLNCSASTMETTTEAIEPGKGTEKQGALDSTPQKPNKPVTLPKPSSSCFDFDEEEPAKPDLQSLGKFGQTRLPRVITPEKSKPPDPLDDVHDIDSLLEEVSVPEIPSLPSSKQDSLFSRGDRTYGSSPFKDTKKPSVTSLVKIDSSSNVNADVENNKHDEKHFLAKGPLQSKKRKSSGRTEGAEDGSAVNKKLKVGASPKKPSKEKVVMPKEEMNTLSEIAAKTSAAELAKQSLIDTLTYSPEPDVQVIDESETTAELKLDQLDVNSSVGSAPRIETKSDVIECSDKKADSNQKLQESALQTGSSKEDTDKDKKVESILSPSSRRSTRNRSVPPVASSPHVVQQDKSEVKLDDSSSLKSSSRRSNRGKSTDVIDKEEVHKSEIFVADSLADIKLPATGDDTRKADVGITMQTAESTETKTEEVGMVPVDSHKAKSRKGRKGRTSSQTTVEQPLFPQDERTPTDTVKKDDSSKPMDGDSLKSPTTDDDTRKADDDISTQKAESAETKTEEVGTVPVDSLKAESSKDRKGRTSSQTTVEQPLFPQDERTPTDAVQKDDSPKPMGGDSLKSPTTDDDTRKADGDISTQKAESTETKTEEVGMVPVDSYKAECRKGRKGRTSSQTTVEQPLFPRDGDSLKSPTSDDDTRKADDDISTQKAESTETKTEEVEVVPVDSAKAKSLVCTEGRTSSQTIVEQALVSQSEITKEDAIQKDDSSKCGDGDLADNAVVVKECFSQHEGEELSSSYKTNHSTESIKLTEPESLKGQTGSSDSQSILRTESPKNEVTKEVDPVAQLVGLNQVARDECNKTSDEGVSKTTESVVQCETQEADTLVNQRPATETEERAIKESVPIESQKSKEIQEMDITVDEGSLLLVKSSPTSRWRKTPSSTGQKVAESLLPGNRSLSNDVLHESPRSSRRSKRLKSAEMLELQSLPDTSCPKEDATEERAESVKSQSCKQPSDTSQESVQKPSSASRKSKRLKSSGGEPQVQAADDLKVESVCADVQLDTTECLKSPLREVIDPKGLPKMSEPPRSSRRSQRNRSQEVPVSIPLPEECLPKPLGPIPLENRGHLTSPTTDEASSAKVSMPVPAQSSKPGHPSRRSTRINPQEMPVLAPEGGLPDDNDAKKNTEIPEILKPLSVDDASPDHAASARDPKAKELAQAAEKSKKPTFTLEVPVSVPLLANDLPESVKSDLIIPAAGGSPKTSKKSSHEVPEMDSEHTGKLQKGNLLIQELENTEAVLSRKGKTPSQDVSVSNLVCSVDTPAAEIAASDVLTSRGIQEDAPLVSKDTELTSKGDDKGTSSKTPEAAPVFKEDKRTAELGRDTSKAVIGQVVDKPKKRVSPKASSRTSKTEVVLPKMDEIREKVPSADSEPRSTLRERKARENLTEHASETHLEKKSPRASRNTSKGDREKSKFGPQEDTTRASKSHIKEKGVKTMPQEGKQLGSRSASVAQEGKQLESRSASEENENKSKLGPQEETLHASRCSLKEGKFKKIPQDDTQHESKSSSKGEDDKPMETLHEGSPRESRSVLKESKSKTTLRDDTESESKSATKEYTDKSKIILQEDTSQKSVSAHKEGKLKTTPQNDGKRDSRIASKKDADKSKTTLQERTPHRSSLKEENYKSKVSPRKDTRRESKGSSKDGEDKSKIAPQEDTPRTPRKLLTEDTFKAVIQEDTPRESRSTSKGDKSKATPREESSRESRTRSKDDKNKSKGDQKGDTPLCDSRASKEDRDKSKIQIGPAEDAPRTSRSTHKEGKARTVPQEDTLRETERDITTKESISVSKEEKDRSKPTIDTSRQSRSASKESQEKSKGSPNKSKKTPQGDSQGESRSAPKEDKAKLRSIEDTPPAGLRKSKRVSSSNEMDTKNRNRKSSSFKDDIHEKGSKEDKLAVESLAKETHSFDKMGSKKSQSSGPFDVSADTMEIVPDVCTPTTSLTVVAPETTTKPVEAPVIPTSVIEGATGDAANKVETGVTPQDTSDPSETLFAKDEHVGADKKSPERKGQAEPVYSIEKVQTEPAKDGKSDRVSSISSDRSPVLAKISDSTPVTSHENNVFIQPPPDLCSSSSPVKRKSKWDIEPPKLNETIMNTVIMQDVAPDSEALKISEEKPPSMVNTSEIAVSDCSKNEIVVNTQLAVSSPTKQLAHSPSKTFSRQDEAVSLLEELLGSSPNSSPSSSPKKTKVSSPAKVTHESPKRRSRAADIKFSLSPSKVLDFGSATKASDMLEPATENSSVPVPKSPESGETSISTTTARASRWDSPFPMKSSLPSLGSSPTSSPVKKLRVEIKSGLGRGCFKSSLPEGLEPPKLPPHLEPDSSNNQSDDELSALQAEIMSYSEMDKAKSAQVIEAKKEVSDVTKELEDKSNSIQPVTVIPAVVSSSKDDSLSPDKLIGSKTSPINLESIPLPPEPAPAPQIKPSGMSEADLLASLGDAAIIIPWDEPITDSICERINHGSSLAPETTTNKPSNLLDINSMSFIMPELTQDESSMLTYSEAPAELTSTPVESVVATDSISSIPLPSVTSEPRPSESKHTAVCGPRTSGPTSGQVQTTSVLSITTPTVHTVALPNDHPVAKPPAIPELKEEVIETEIITDHSELEQINCQPPPGVSEDLYSEFQQALVKKPWLRPDMLELWTKDRAPKKVYEAQKVTQLVISLYDEDHPDYDYYMSLPPCQVGTTNFTPSWATAPGIKLASDTQPSSLTNIPKTPSEPKPTLISSNSVKLLPSITNSGSTSLPESAGKEVMKTDSSTRQMRIVTQAGAAPVNVSQQSVSPTKNVEVTRQNISKLLNKFKAGELDAESVRRLVEAAQSLKESKSVAKVGGQALANSSSAGVRVQPRNIAPAVRTPIMRASPAAKIVTTTPAVVSQPSPLMVAAASTPSQPKPNILSAATSVSEPLKFTMQSKFRNITIGNNSPKFVVACDPVTGVTSVKQNVAVSKNLVSNVNQQPSSAGTIVNTTQTSGAVTSVVRSTSSNTAQASKVVCATPSRIAVPSTSQTFTLVTSGPVRSAVPTTTQTFTVLTGGRAVVTSKAQTSSTVNSGVKLATALPQQRRVVQRVKTVTQPVVPVVPNARISQPQPIRVRKQPMSQSQPRLVQRIVAKPETFTVVSIPNIGIPTSDQVVVVGTKKPPSTAPPGSDILAKALADTDILPSDSEPFAEESTNLLNPSPVVISGPLGADQLSTISFDPAETDTVVNR